MRLLEIRNVAVTHLKCVLCGHVESSAFLAGSAGLRCEGCGNYNDFDVVGHSGVRAISLPWFRWLKNRFTKKRGAVVVDAASAMFRMGTERGSAFTNLERRRRREVKGLAR